MTSLASQHISSEIQGGAVALEKPTTVLPEVPASAESLTNAAEGMLPLDQLLSSKEVDMVYSLVDYALYDKDKGTAYDATIRKQTLGDVENMLQFVLPEHISPLNRRDIVDQVAANIIDSKLQLETQYHQEPPVSQPEVEVAQTTVEHISPRRTWVAKLARASMLAHAHAA